jgi:hypothetical protein
MSKMLLNFPRESRRGMKFFIWSFLSMRRMKLCLFGVCADINYVCFENALKETTFVLSMRGKKLCLFWICAERNYVYFEYALKETMFGLSMRRKKLQYVCFEYAGNKWHFHRKCKGCHWYVTQNYEWKVTFIYCSMHRTIFAPHWVYAKWHCADAYHGMSVRGTMFHTQNKVQLILSTVCAGIDCSFHTTERILFKKKL